MKPLPMAATSDNNSCCGTAPAQTCCTAKVPPSDYSKYPWITGTIPTPVGTIPTITTTLTGKDRWGTIKVRWSFGRNSYSVPPGLYGVGTPTPESSVLVTANYKLTLDTLRRELTDLNVWILVLDTKGINVWCAAGKGTFGTAEIVNRVQTTGLSSVVSHRTLILPQLGAPGVSAHEVSKLSGFKVIYGPIRAEDVKKFLSDGMNATPDMRRVRFTTHDRLILAPVELVPAVRTAIFAFGILFVLNSIGLTHFNAVDMWAILGAIVAGAFLSPVLLPWLPGRMFSLKGALLGLLWACFIIASASPGILCSIGYLLLLPATAAFLSMNFTGASTYTSFSGVKKEMTLSVPPIAVAGILGIILLLADSALRLSA